jgi:hypothetical protein
MNDDPQCSVCGSGEVDLTDTQIEHGACGRSTELVNRDSPAEDWPGHNVHSIAVRWVGVFRQWQSQ